MKNQKNVPTGNKRQHVIDYVKLAQLSSEQEDLLLQYLRRLAKRSKQ